ncbi:hypothetical protein COLO4_35785 [Corchorus olitorius]|uniref:Uncharacterized protein n=1 Tax=Corchorus olitorius TaxID=93759 RepID=A0A1R3GDC1_9ROSI|nr:hypothetical protein COLO4_35785 [Corchorus olitorius]
MAIVLQHSRKGSLESIGMVGEYALSTQHHQHTEPSPSLSSEEQFIESSSSAKNDQLTESPALAPGADEAISIESSSSGEYQFTNALPPSAQGPSPVFSPDCNYAKGSWVADSRRPLLYSGFGCRRWLVAKWSCRRSNRTDFSYEGYRWQPNDCNIPEFEPSAFLKKMQDKTIAIIGDSLGKQQFQSLMCMASGGWKVQKLIMLQVSMALSNLPEPNMHLDGLFGSRVQTPPFYFSGQQTSVTKSTFPTEKLAPRFTRRSMGMYVNGKHIEKKLELEDMRNARNFTVHSIVRWLDSQVALYPRLKAFFRTNSPSHFRSGEWNTGGSCNNTIPLTQGSEVLQDESSDKDVASAVKGTKVKILDITAISELRDEAHISSSHNGFNGINDCLHWCLPGVPDTWNELLIAQI